MSLFFIFFSKSIFWCLLFHFTKNSSCLVTAFLTFFGIPFVAILLFSFVLLSVDGTNCSVNFNIVLETVSAWFKLFPSSFFRFGSKKN